MIEFTQEEISLCKQVAGKHKKKIKFGDWYHREDGCFLMESHDTFSQEWVEKHWTPLWTISDCLEFLEKKPGLHTLEIIGDYKNLEWNVVLNWERLYKGKTPLEACLKAVLACLRRGSENIKNY
ncbi:MAG: hypothetical protein V3V81_07890 [Candidatus Bathyarchaeia archaeon]